jgi:hypothetical protein
MWELLGGDAGARGREPLFGGPQPFRVMSVDRNIDGRLAVFGLAEDDSVWHNGHGRAAACRWSTDFGFLARSSVGTETYSAAAPL